jgi:hypothetical protein
VSENSVLREILGPKQQEDGENYIMRNFIIYTPYSMIFPRVVTGELE